MGTGCQFQLFSKNQDHLLNQALDENSRRFRAVNFTLRPQESGYLLTVPYGLELKIRVRFYIETYLMPSGAPLVYNESYLGADSASEVTFYRFKGIEGFLEKIKIKTKEYGYDTAERNLDDSYYSKMFLRLDDDGRASKKVLKIFEKSGASGVVKGVSEGSFSLSGLKGRQELLGKILCRKNRKFEKIEFLENDQNCHFLSIEGYGCLLCSLLSRVLFIFGPNSV